MDDQDPRAGAPEPDEEQSSPARTRNREEAARRRAVRAAARGAREAEEERARGVLGQIAQLNAQWSALRLERERQLAMPDVGGDTPVSAKVPPGVDLAAAWAWRFLVIVAAGGLIAYLVAYFSVVVVPILVALLLSALVVPVVNLLGRVLPRGLAALVTVVVGLALISAALTFVGQQIANGANDLADSTVQGLGQIREWLKNGPLQASDTQIDDYINEAQLYITQQFTAEPGQSSQLISRITELGTTLSHVFAGLFIALFSTYFFLADGSRIWGWVVRIAPRAARDRVDSSGHVAWISLTQFVRATVIVAFVDALGISIWAQVMGLPFVFAIGVLVFLGAFIPMIGATIAGTVAVLVALVDQGAVAALVMLVGVIVVQQLEGHILQPFLMGRWVSVHPLAVIVAIAVGVLVAGIAGALVAVPAAAALNAVVLHLASLSTPAEPEPVPGDAPPVAADAAPASGSDEGERL
ncbi:AI-2E family transporter [Nocardioides bruguierae]|uniref:AI-2E family transporter n=1 Tax=Nocardioides bruguierae TaxID=2945102 RepID=UPI0020206264|nr:AI-2E family transporter [Nocardioides bruguierae]MCL8027181.1 AI-2E family transporter [Nocardioides bruguierae]